MTRGSFGKCAMCQKDSVLRDSHIIPKFAFEYIKKTSATGYLRNVTTINRRLQDGPKQKMLCEDCEQRLSKSEKYFAENVFTPYTTHRPNSVSYDENLIYFAASLAFRFMVVNEDFKIKEPQFAQQYDIAKENLRKYLLGLEVSPKNLFHMLPVHHEIADIPEGLSEKIVWYFARSADGDIVCTDDYALVYAKLPYFMIFMPFVNGEGLSFLNTEIKSSGKLNLYEPIDYRIPDGFFGYIEGRVNKIFSTKLSESQTEKLNNDVAQKSERAKNSESALVRLSEEMLRKSRRK